MKSVIKKNKLTVSTTQLNDIQSIIDELGYEVLDVPSTLNYHVKLARLTDEQPSRVMLSRDESKYQVYVIDDSTGKEIPGLRETVVFKVIDDTGVKNVAAKSSLKNVLNNLGTNSKQHKKVTNNLPKNSTSVKHNHSNNNRLKGWKLPIFLATLIVIVISMVLWNANHPNNVENKAESSTSSRLSSTDITHSNSDVSTSPDISSDNQESYSTVAESRSETNDIYYPRSQSTSISNVQYQPTQTTYSNQVNYQQSNDSSYQTSTVNDLENQVYSWLNSHGIDVNDY